MLKSEDIKLADFNIENLLHHPIMQELDRIKDTFLNVQETILKLSEDDTDANTTAVKSGTVFVFALIGKITSGRLPNEFTREDWTEIANEVMERAVIEEDRSYTEYVFQLYADYLDTMATALGERISGKVTDSIHSLAREIREESKKLREEQISEPDYVEKCLWIALEGVVKLIAATAASAGGSELTEFTAAVGSLSVQYGRLMMYQKEQAFVDKLLKHQHQLDDELQREYEQYAKEVEANSEYFKSLIEDAFSPDIRDRLLGSVSLAKEAGVREEDILQTEDDIDSFFLD